jgi:NAD(P)-dependent dehydrogenase (short-subunit alcohol dehydrogenase family)
MANVLITGANRGIGLQLAKQYSERGDHVLACCRNPDKADALNALAGENLSVHKLDPTDTKAIAALASSAPGVDILINNAGTPGPAPDQQSAMSMDFDGWLETFNVNTLAPLKVLQGFHPLLKKGKDPKAITITSQMGALDLNWPTMYAYCSSKAAVNKVMRMISVELAADKIAVALIHPGWVKTDMGGDGADITPEESAAGIISVIDNTTLDNTGSFMKWNGEPHAW